MFLEKAVFGPLFLCPLKSVPFLRNCLDVGNQKKNNQSERSSGTYFGSAQYK